MAALVALFSMLFMQLAVASYACPGNGAPAVSTADCAGMDASQPSLCKAKSSDLTSRQSLDKPDLPPLLPFAPADLAGLVADVEPLPLRAEWRAAPPGWARSIAPPIAIQHCCFLN